MPALASGAISMKKSATAWDAVAHRLSPLTILARKVAEPARPDVHVFAAANAGDGFTYMLGG